MLITVVGKALPSSRHWLPVRQFGQTKQSLMLLSVFVLRERNKKKTSITSAVLAGFYLRRRVMALKTARI